MMKAGQLEIVNLQIDKAGRLVDKAELKEQSQGLIKPLSLTDIEAEKAWLIINKDTRMADRYYDANRDPNKEAELYIKMARTIINKYSNIPNLTWTLKNDRTELSLNGELVGKMDGQKINMLALKVACGLLDYKLHTSVSEDSTSSGVLRLNKIDENTYGSHISGHDKNVMEKILKMNSAFCGSNGSGSNIRFIKEKGLLAVGNGGIDLTKTDIKNGLSIDSILVWLMAGMNNIGYEAWYEHSMGYNHEQDPYTLLYITKKGSLEGRIQALKFYVHTMTAFSDEFRMCTGGSTNSLYSLPTKKLRKMIGDISNELEDIGFSAFKCRDKDIKYMVHTILEDRNVPVR